MTEKPTTYTTSLGAIQSFGPVALEQRAGGRWVVNWSINWEFAELADAVDRYGTIVGIMSAAAGYRVKVVITPERAVGQKGKAKP